jgi:hypothetical protein
MSLSSMDGEKGSTALPLEMDSDPIDCDQTAMGLPVTSAVFIIAKSFL